MVEHLLMVQWVIGSIPQDGFIKLFHKAWYVLSCLWDGAYKRSLVLIRKSSLYSGGSAFSVSLSEWSFVLTPNKM